MNKIDNNGYVFSIMLFGILILFLTVFSALILTMDNSFRLNKVLKQKVIDDIQTTDVPKKVCIRAETLHTETCNWTDETYYCNGSGTGYSNGDTITYGNLGTNGKLTSGDAFDCDVDGNGTYDEDERFYYVTDSEENSDVAVLIYYSNIKNGEANNTSEGLTAYDGTHGEEEASQNWHGPITAITNLPTNNQWSNVSLAKEIRPITNENGGNTTSGGTLPNNFSYKGYSARLLTYQEMTKVCGTGEIIYAGYLDACNYLMENTIYSSNSVETWGYWLENPLASYSNLAWVVSGERFSNGSFVLYSSYYYGVRPVIEVPKKSIEIYKVQ